ncbi:hypothetical protein [Thalassotalea aquiviva]|uniref:hypothetical protein n=1 Tax=Thalassotalea aquiviva TaxID=3242415 RepID=UPI00352B5C6A
MLKFFTRFFSNKISEQHFCMAVGKEKMSFILLDRDKNEHSIKIWRTTVIKDICRRIESLFPRKKIHGDGVLVLPSSLYYALQTDKPNVPEDEVAAALKWQIKDIVPIPVEDMVVDYADYPITVAGKAKVNVVCSQLSVLKQVYRSVNKTKAQLKSIISEEIAFANLLEISPTPVLLVYQPLGDEVFLLIVQAGQIYFQRKLRGFSAISQMDETQLEGGICDALSVELQKSMDYFERQLKQQSIQYIRVLLPSEHEPLIIEKLMQNTLLDVQSLAMPDPYSNRAHAAGIGGIIELTLMESRHD